MRTSFFILLLLFSFIATKLYSQVVINEYSCSNIKRTIVEFDTIWFPIDTNRYPIDTTWYPIDSTWYKIDTTWNPYNYFFPNDSSSLFGDNKFIGLGDSIIADSSYYLVQTSKEDTTCVTCRDNFDKLEDWIEFYNSGNKPVDISGYYISDNEKKPLKYQQVID